MHRQQRTRRRRAKESERERGKASTVRYLEIVSPDQNFRYWRVATKPQRKLFLEGHLPRRSRRSNRTENTEPRADNGRSWTTRPPGSLSISQSLFLFIFFTCRNNNRPLRTQLQRSFIDLVVPESVPSLFSFDTTATFYHFLTFTNPEPSAEPGGSWLLELNHKFERRTAREIIIKRDWTRDHCQPIPWIQLEVEIFNYYINYNFRLIATRYFSYLLTDCDQIFLTTSLNLNNIKIILIALK